MGSLGGLIASRIAREFKIGRPRLFEYLVLAIETSGIQALAIAAGWLRAGELDAAIVGAVDFAGDTRAVMARRQIRGDALGPSCACDGAVALVVKRLDDALTPMEEIASTRSSARSPRALGDRMRLMPRAMTTPLQEIASIETDLGDAGAGCRYSATVAKAALCLDRRILPALGSVDGPSFWMRNRAEGPRRARVSVSSLGDNHGHVTLEEFGENRLTERRGPLLARMRIGLFAIEADDESGLARRMRELSDMARASSGLSIDSLATQWWQRHPNDTRLRLGKAVVADSPRNARANTRSRQPGKSRASIPVPSGFRIGWRLSTPAWETNSALGWDEGSFRPGGLTCARCAQDSGKWPI